MKLLTTLICALFSTVAFSGELVITDLKSNNWKFTVGVDPEKHSKEFFKAKGEEAKKRFAELIKQASNKDVPNEDLKQLREQIKEAKTEKEYAAAKAKAKSPNASPLSILHPVGEHYQEGDYIYINDFVRVDKVRNEDTFIGLKTYENAKMHIVFTGCDTSKLKVGATVEIEGLMQLVKPELLDKRLTDNRTGVTRDVVANTVVLKPALE